MEKKHIGKFGAEARRRMKEELLKETEHVNRSVIIDYGRTEQPEASGSKQRGFINSLVCETEHLKAKSIENPIQRLKVLQDLKNKVDYYIASGDWTDHRDGRDFSEMLRLDIERISKTKAPANQPKTSYTWLNNPNEELPELHQKMIKAGLIAPDTDPENFKNVFKGQPLNEVDPIRWEKEHNLLAWFIKKLFGYIEKEKNPWDIAKYCFTYFSREASDYILADNLRQANQRRKGNSKPKKSYLVDELFNPIQQ